MKKTTALYALTLVYIFHTAHPAPTNAAEIKKRANDIVRQFNTLHKQLKQRGADLKPMVPIRTQLVPAHRALFAKPQPPLEVLQQQLATLEELAKPLQNIARKLEPTQASAPAQPSRSTAGQQPATPHAATRTRLAVITQAHLRVMRTKAKQLYQELKPLIIKMKKRSYKIPVIKAIYERFQQAYRRLFARTPLPPAQLALVGQSINTIAKEVEQLRQEMRSSYTQPAPSPATPTPLNKQQIHARARVLFQRNGLPAAAIEKLLAQLQQAAPEQLSADSADLYINTVLQEYIDANLAPQKLEQKGPDFCIPVIDYTAKVKKQTGLTCGYHAAFNAAQILAHLRHPDNAAAAAQELARGPNIAQWKQQLKKAVPGAELENIGDESATYVAQTLAGIAPQDVTIIANIPEFTPKDFLSFQYTLAELIRTIQQTNGFTHAFLLGSMRHTPGSYARSAGHWTTAVVQNHQGKPRLFIADSAAAQQHGSPAHIQKLAQLINSDPDTIQRIIDLENSLESAVRTFYDNKKPGRTLVHLNKVKQALTPAVIASPFMNRQSRDDLVKLLRDLLKVPQAEPLARELLARF